MPLSQYPAIVPRLEACSFCLADPLFTFLAPRDMADQKTDVEMLRQMKASYASALKEFTSSGATFRVLRSIPTNNPPNSCPIRTLYVLDSSFNPPSRIHMQIATSALQHDQGAKPHRLLLLFATQNADKAPKPASFEDRLVMMTLFAQALRDETGNNLEEERPSVDIGVTKLPYYHDKAASIDQSGVYDGQPQQVHLAGFDSIIRIFNTKYYPPDHTFAVLEPFLSRHRLRVRYRPDDEWGGRVEQRKYVQDIADGKREMEGAKPEWADRIQLVEGKAEGEEVVSSTLARKAAKTDPKSLEKYVTRTIQDWIISEKLYLEGEVNK
jgi:nicotinamide-nucleotide adenylyltransferase